MALLCRTSKAMREGLSDPLSEKGIEEVLEQFGEWKRLGEVPGAEPVYPANYFEDSDDESDDGGDA